MTTSSAPVSTPPPATATPTKSSSFGSIVLDISNSLIPLSRLTSTPSAQDGLNEEMEMQVRSLAADLIQVAGKLLRLPQVAMATGCVLFHRFYYAKSFVRIPFDVVAMAAIGLASKIEENPRRIRDIINVFNHIKQVRAGKPCTPVILDSSYINLKNQVIKAERRVLKELGFCVHVKHPHKIIVMYLQWLKLGRNAELMQMSWNFMNDSLRTDMFVRYPPETIAVACIYLSARKLGVPLPKNPAWFEVLSVEEDDIKDCCFRMICLYNRKKPNQDELEAHIDSLRRKMEENRRRKITASNNPTAANSTVATPSGSPLADKSNNATAVANGKEEDKFRSRSRTPNGRDSNKKKKKHRRSRSSSREDTRRDRKKSRKRSRSRSHSYSPPKKSKKSHKEKSRSSGHHRSTSDYNRESGRNGSRYDKYAKGGKRDDYYRR